ncbi:ribosome small subunit-dependent GTPase A [Parasphaerochaeta coccoides]|uniref:Small ribosomal subunit biogenesis GTPase RsgA n=1 Tax=Parasphaerochaeta coccoides (strain ATCC BAA-1237 / DSM 17374 / SPN1) TaxID=760011 RepID=F4GIH4_PARC1|nr:ribosome small subunit-dependent GTPase A [Parasphaerochaeta coccoides]AEC01682.1 ribosome biogenesis GTPase RsgA [Parasphaerochaeta coccoides DSM 17374]
MGEAVEGTVTRGINNIYTVIDSDGTAYLCRIKGKQLVQAAGEYNPIVAGDRVLFQPVEGSGEALILERLERTSFFARWNEKGQRNQIVAANMDIVVCVSSVASPPFRPRFIDRVIACSRNVETVIILNKCDIAQKDAEAERFALFSELGYRTIRVSAAQGEGLDEVRGICHGKTVAFIGQSGVGKSTLINALLDGTVVQRTGGISRKFDRGRHTTNYATMLFGKDFTLIDTPGVREISVPHDDPHAIEASFPEFASYRVRCQFEGCLHDEEPGCAVRDAADAGLIHEDRYESYLRMLASLEERAPSWAVRPRAQRNRYADDTWDKEEWDAHEDA